MIYTGKIFLLKAVKFSLLILIGIGILGSILATWDIIQQIEPDFSLEWSVIGCTIILLAVYRIVVSKLDAPKIKKYM